MSKMTKHQTEVERRSKAIYDRWRASWPEKPGCTLFTWAELCEGKHGASAEPYRALARREIRRERKVFDEAYVLGERRQKHRTSWGKTTTTTSSPKPDGWHEQLRKEARP